MSTCVQPTLTDGRVTRVAEERVRGLDVLLRHEGGGDTEGLKNILDDFDRSTRLDLTEGLRAPRVLRGIDTGYVI